MEWLLLLLLLLLSGCCKCPPEKPEPPSPAPTAAPAATPKPQATPKATPKPPQSVRAKVLSVAGGLIGTTEATGKNDGPVIEAILASTGNKKGDPYCAAFNYYCYREAGAGSLVPRSAWSPDWVRNPSWTRSHGGSEPKPADAFGIYFSSKKRVAHTGLVKSWGDSSVLTIEGNTSPDAAPGTAADRDGGGIWSKRRLIRQIHSTRDWIGG